MTSAKSITPAQLIRQRLRAHGLAGPLGSTVEDVVRRYGALQGEKYPFTRWSIALRAPGINAQSVDHALATGTILRTHILRPTWHLVLPEDLRWLQRLCGPRVRELSARRFAELNLDARTLRRSESILVRALQGGPHLSRAQLGAALSQAGIDVSGQRLTYIMFHAEFECLVCSGAPIGSTQTYALFDERALATVRFEGEEALAELARRYFTAHGPASERDFRWWASLRASDAKLAIAAAGPALQCVEWAGRTYWLAPESTLPQTRRSAAVYLLPVLDQYLIGYTESRSLVLADESAGSSAFGSGNRFHWIVQSGRVIGRWRVVRARNGLAMDLSTFQQVDTATRRGIERAVQRYGRFFEQPVQLTAWSVASG